MNTTITDLASIHRTRNALLAEVSIELAKHSTAELRELAETHLREPTTVYIAAIESPSKLVTMAAIPIELEILRRLEVSLMER